MLALNVLLALNAVAAVTLLILRYGFARVRPVPLGILNPAGGVILALFVLDRLVRMFLARRRWKQVVARNWLDYALMVVAGVALAISFRTRAQVYGLGAAYIVVTHAYIFFVLLLRASGLNQRMAESGLGPAKIFLLSFAVICLAGSGLLMLPAAHPDGDSSPAYLDALFTSVSATCVTGLITMDTGSDWSAFGQAVILVLIQLGGLGIMIFGTVLTMMMGKRLGLRGSRALGEMVAAETGQVSRVVQFVVLTTFVLETIGALCLWLMYSGLTAGGEPLLTARQSIWFSVFHSVSAFCNAGFSLHDANLAAGLGAGWDAPLRAHWQILGVFSPLIILGGLGFPVLEDLWGYLRTALQKLRRRHRRVVVGEQEAPRPHLTLQSKIVLTVSGGLIVLGAAGIWLLTAWTAETGGSGADSWSAMGPWQKLHQSLFLSVSTRTAGFNTFDLSGLSDATKLLICIWMSIGGSPAGTAGGMKTVTFVLLLMTVVATLRRRDDVEIFRRSISNELLRKTVAVGVLYALLVVTVTMGLLTAMAGRLGFVDLLFEACSACGTVGLSTGATGQLNPAGKVIVIAAMFTGRLGPITLLLALTARPTHVKYSYPSEDLTIG
jgi:trk system potassium uptake protein TrkH